MITQGSEQKILCALGGCVDVPLWVAFMLFVLAIFLSWWFYNLSG